MKMKVKSHVAAIYGILFVAFTAVMALVWNQKNYIFWCFYISTVLILANLFFLHCCMAGDSDRRALVISQTLFIPPAVAYIAVCITTWVIIRISAAGKPGTYHDLLAMDIIIFAVSVIVQICLFHVKKRFSEQKNA